MAKSNAVKVVKEKLKLVYLKTDVLEKLPDNPRKLADLRAKEKLRNEIEKHGFQNPLQVYLEKSKKYIILCGNHRFDVGCDMGMKEFPCIVYKGDRKMAMDRAIADNKSQELTDWDYGILSKWSNRVDLKSLGFDEEDFRRIFKEKTNQPDAPVYPLTPQFSEQYNYVVIFCKNGIDWVNLQSMLPLETERNYKSHNKNSIGVSRVITYERFKKLWDNRKVVKPKSDGQPSIKAKKKTRQ